MVTIQIFRHGRWHTAATFTPDRAGIKRGIAGGGLFEYGIDYAVEHQGESTAQVAFSYPVTFELHRSDRWPAFLLDLMPTGAGRRVWLRRLGLRDGTATDWELLVQGAGNPPGNLRVAEAVIPPGAAHRGFTREEIIDKSADFIEYAEARGAVVAGATDVQGDAPKFLLVRDRNRRWHPDGALEDGEVLDCWLIKFPRGKTGADLTVLRNEAPYLEVARRFGLRVGAPLQFEGDALFIPRFDRSVGPTGLERHGFETLCAAAGIAEFGKRGDHSHFCEIIARFAASPQTELIEYLRRDILNAALRNTDNHGRNTAFLKQADGTVRLSPLFDFAPMFLDPEGIPRSSRWAAELEPEIGRPDWGKVVESQATRIDPNELRRLLTRDAEAVARLPETMRACGVEDSVIDRVARRCAEVAEDLRDAGAKG
ncbi:type II toxin-antitoxin system HipA family toxin [Trichloromonas sp.]|uniref:type II toxin-antitoxin system HipA family toxin n=1 Tax=Trichloromonas sp. TaxID=3069249 RepID=UPI003D815652